MGELVAGVKQEPIRDLCERYQSLLTEAVRLNATVRKNCNVLMHIMGYFKKQLPADEKKELLEIIDRYRLRYVPVIVPVTIVNHYVRKYRPPYLASQHYLSAHPVELALRNRA